MVYNTDHLYQDKLETFTLLDAGSLPVEELAALAIREGRRPRPVYQVHRWFARRFGSAFRALLTAAALPVEADFWPAYYNGTDWRGRSVLDPFVGGGTSIVEALRLGANVTGVDVDAVACAVTRLETHLHTIPNLISPLEELKRLVGGQLASYYRTITAEGETREVLHYFWVQVVQCMHCGQTFEAHPHYQLAYEAEGTLQWVFCPHCHEVKTLPRTEPVLFCEQCNLKTSIHDGTARHGCLTCPCCQGKERLIEVAKRTHCPPQWRIFALETLEASTSKVVPMKHRRFRPATEHDQAVLVAAQQALESRKMADGTFSWIPERRIPQDGRTDNRLIDYGYRTYRELFNPRQLLHLSLLAEAVSSLEEPVRGAMAIAFSDHLTTNCMMTHYAFGWRRLAPLFSIRAYCHMTRPVEINPWIDGTGRGTYPNAIRQVQRAIEWTRTPKEALADGGFCATRNLALSEKGTGSQSSANIVHSNAQRLHFLPDETIDLVLTDPPYFDNIAYSELSDFFLPWLQLFGLAPSDDEGEIGFNENMAARRRDEKAVSQFQQALQRCFSEIARVLKPKGRLVFTYQHKTPMAWHALAVAFAGTNLRPLQLFPLLGDGNTGLHKHVGNSTWDAVFVMIRDERAKKTTDLTLSKAAVQAARKHYAVWTRRLMNQTISEFREADQKSFYRACLVAATFNLFPISQDCGTLIPLIELLDENPPPM